MIRRSALLAALALAAAACSDSPTGAPARAPEPDVAATARVIPGRYIVVLRGEPAASPDASPTEFSARAERAREAVDEKAAPFGERVRFRYAHAIRGFAAQLTDAEVTALRADADVAYVEPDQEMRASATQSSATWGIDRIDQRSLPRSGTYTYTATASAVRAYIIDTGIQTSHSNFGGRASNVYDAFGGNGQDCNGHGTHVAGTVGSATWGVAKAVMLRGVRVLDCSGSGSNSGVVAGINWVAANHIKPAVANMSLGGGASQATDDAVNALSNAGVFTAVAAGNENQSACNVSPARAANVTTVASSTSSDAKSSFSNWGSCVELYAPGSSITSTWLNGTSNTISGTSMASPHVAGVGALYKATYGDVSSSTIRSWLVNNATANVITGNVTGTPNRLLYKGSL